MLLAGKIEDEPYRHPWDVFSATQDIARGFILHLFGFFTLRRADSVDGQDTLDPGTEVHLTVA